MLSTLLNGWRLSSSMGRQPFLRKESANMPNMASTHMRITFNITLLALAKISEGMTTGLQDISGTANPPFYLFIYLSTELAVVTSVEYQTYMCLRLHKN
jgi:hypothetical protein